MSKSPKFAKIIKNLPSTPGVYIYKDADGKIIYVGKAINLKRRVSQYFQRDDALGPKTSLLVSQIAAIEIKPLDSELQALILESSLIKLYKPKYNSLMKDDKSYSYICITKDPLPIVFSTHRSDIPKNSFVYGPFPNSFAVKSLLKTIRRIFPFYQKANHPKRKCLYCHLGICPGPDPDPKKYRQNIGKVKKLLSGNFKLLQRQLKKEMAMYSKEENFETALNIRDQIASIDYIVNGWDHLKYVFDDPNLPQDNISSAVNQLTTTLSQYFPHLKQINRIEAFDISNLGSKYFVGSMVVFQNNHIDKDQYRKFKIYTKNTQDDQFMIKEVVWRRLKHPEWTMPDIILVDGGKPQVSAAVQAISLASKSFVLIGLAKKHETIVIKTPTGWQEISLPLSSSALRLLVRLRDEAHRFANNYRKSLMKKSLLG